MRLKRKLGEPRLLLGVVEDGQDYEGDGAILRGDEWNSLQILVRALDLYIDQPAKDLTEEGQKRQVHAKWLKKQFNDVRRILSKKRGEHYAHMVLGRSVHVQSLEETIRRTEKIHREVQE